ncbi:MAG TPA: glycosyltransferase, partial [Bacteroidia bacterium]|nr:glycosyltransferase [Bacteroidia bacterium]
KKVTLIPHGTHLVEHIDKVSAKAKYDLVGKNVLATFGLLSEGKNIETTLAAMPAIIASHPETMFLVIGKTHPTVVKQSGEAYRARLEQLVETLGIGEHVRFVNRFLPLGELLEYLQMADVYLFTSKDPHQAVSGTFSYAISCGCPVISTPIPHAREVLGADAGIIIGFEAPQQLADAAISLLSDANMAQNLRANGLHKMASTAWENAAIAYGNLFQQIARGNFNLHYAIPAVRLDHVQKMTTPFGMIQFSKVNQPDLDSGYTLDDNARALIALCQQYELTRDAAVLPTMATYVKFIQYCLQDEGYFLNYVNERREFTPQNKLTNLADSNGRAIWALGYLISIRGCLPEECIGLVNEAEAMMDKAALRLRNMHSTRAMAFAIKGLYYRNCHAPHADHLAQIRELANRLVQMYRHEASPEWLWFESYLTYANGCLPEALLCAGLATGDPIYMEIAKSSFDFLLGKTLSGNRIRVISNQNWLQRGDANDVSDKDNHRNGGEQPIDVAYTIFALAKFAEAFPDENYLSKMEIAFDWFLGNNHLHQIIYNPCTGGCYDGLEADHVNLNQGAESTLSYLMARLTVEKARQKQCCRV